MQSDGLFTGPPIPESEVEWEDLLLRLEIMLRAIKVAVEGVDVSSTEADSILTELVEREEWARVLLEGVAGPRTERPSAVDDDRQLSVYHTDAVDRFVRVRARNFAMIQRRGVDVWEWSLPAGEGSTATVHQLLTFLAREDARVLARLRATSGRRSAC